MKKLIERVKLFFVMVFGGARKVEEFLKLHVDDAISFIQQIKMWVDSPVITMVIHLSPAKYRDKINEVLAKVEQVIEKVLDGLNIGQECINKATFQEKLACAIDYIRNQPQNAKEEIYRNIGVAYIQERSKESTKDGSPIPESTARTMLEMQYQAVKAEAAIPPKKTAKKKAA